MRGAWRSFLIAALAAGALGTSRAEDRPPHTGAQPPKPAFRAPALAVPARPGKNPQTALGGPAKYDAKKAAVLGGAAPPRRR